MTTPLLRRAAATTAGLAAVLCSVAIASPASAEVYSKSDPAGDVAGFGGEDPDIKNGDIRKVRFEHARRNVTLRATFRDLAKGQDDFIQQYVRIDTPTNGYRLAVFASSENRQGELAFFQANEGGDLPRACRNVAWRFDYADDVFTMSVPRGCVNDPRWVRVGLGTLTPGSGAGGEGDFRIDDALQDGFTFDQQDVRASPRLSRAGGSYQG